MLPLSSRHQPEPDSRLEEAPGVGRISTLSLCSTRTKQRPSCAFTPRPFRGTRGKGL